MKFSEASMDSIPEPIFQNKLAKVSWQKIYEREYGVQYSEAAVALLAEADYHFPVLSTDQVVFPSSGGTAFYADGISWIRLIEGLDKKYSSSVKKVEQYEKQFNFDGNNYLKFAKSLSKLNLKKLSNEELLGLFVEHKNKKNKYTVFIWSAFILNDFIAGKAASILDKYIKTSVRESERQDMLDSLFKPEKKAAILQLQYEVEKRNGKLSEKLFNELYENFKWLSCLDLHNKPWTREDFKEHIKHFNKSQNKHVVPFAKYAHELQIKPSDLEYLQMAKRFVYIKDARDDFRRESVYNTLGFFAEIGKRMNLNPGEVSYVQESEIIDFLQGKKEPSKEIISQRKKGFVIYLSANKKLICLQGADISKAEKLFKLVFDGKVEEQITGMVASKGLARGRVAIVRGVKDLEKVKEGDVLVAVATHPDYVSAMRRAVAIVTDEGGVTSHAAIVAREFGIPCIVGTKQATKILKDGDMLKVNAEEGFVEKL